MGIRKHRLIVGWLMMLVCAVGMTDANANATQEVEVTLSHPASKIEAESGIVVFTIKNKSAETIFLPVQWTPGSAPDSRLMGPVVDIVSAAGKKLEYRGNFYGIIVDKNDDPARLYTRVEPGQTLRREVNLARDYDLKAGGAYQVSYKQYYRYFRDIAGKGSAEREVQSNTLSIWVNTSLINAAALSRALSGEEDKYQRACTASEENVLRDAKQMASSWIREGWMKAFNLYEREDYYDPMALSISSATHNAKLKADRPYERWMGSPLNDLQPAESGRDLYDPEVWDHMDFMPLHLAYAASTRIDRAFLTCGCHPDSDPRLAAVARVQNPNIPYEIRICDHFFDLPLALTGEPSQAGALIHEISHFSDDKGPMTFDYRYGRADSEELARSDHARAVFNADSFSFWIETMNIPE